ncbi:synaptosome-associated proteinsynaptosomal-associated protein 25 [Phellopilus nigrolimitatus]|nr:synaptosome-associated proteinsynaptosomal-associated protein 25 [Phellopilus nigrolimitatus]
MSWFNRNAKNKSVIPPVEEPSTGKPASAPPSYRSTSSTSVPSRGGDTGPRAYGSSYNMARQNSDVYGGNTESKVGGYGGANRPNYGARQNSDGHDSNGPSAYDPQSQPRGRNENGVMGGVSDPYGRGERDINADRNALFSGAVRSEDGQQSNRFMDGPDGLGRSPPGTGEEEEEEIEGIKTATKSLKQDTVSSTRNALRIAREAGEVGSSTLLRLGEQSEKIANTERHIDVSKGHALRAEDNAEEIRKLNRSIFIPAITFNKDAKRQAQELKRRQRYEEEQFERELAMKDIRDSQKRVGNATDGRPGNRGDDEEGIGGYGRQKTNVEQNLRMEQRKRYQFEATASDDEMEDEIDDNLDEMLDATKRLKMLGVAMGSELQTQNSRLERITDKTDKLGSRVDANTNKLRRIAR